MALNETISLVTAFSIPEGYSILQPLSIFVIGMVIYAVFVYKFYTFLARKDVFDLDLDKYNKSKHPGIIKFFGIIAYIIKYIIIFPLFVFFWFVVLSALLAFLSKNSDLQSILLTSMAIVAAVRVTAYYTEDLSKDLAKMIPFALLGVFIVDITFFSFADSLVALKEFPMHWKIMSYYLIFTIGLEFLLRILYTVTLPFRPKAEEE